MRLLATIMSSLLALGCCEALSPGAEEYVKILFTSDFGYTMLGVKPVSMNYGKGYNPRRMKREEKAEAKSFLENTFSFSGNFILYRSQGIYVLINKKAVQDLYQDNRTFRRFIKRNFGGVGDFLFCLYHSRKNPVDFLKDDTVLLSILLGYGEDNGHAYQLFRLLRNLSENHPIVDYDAIREDMPEHWVDIEDQMDVPIPYAFSIPAYWSCRSDEAWNIHQRFLSARRCLAELFYIGRPSEIVSILALDD